MKGEGISQRIYMITHGQRQQYGDGHREGD